MADDLAARGHNVTLLVSSIYYSNIVESIDPDSADDMHIEQFPGIYDLANADGDKFNKLALTGRAGWYSMFLAFEVIVPECDLLLSDKAVLIRLKNSQFDLIVTCELTPCGALLAHHLGLPFVLISSNRVIPEWDADMYNIPNNMAYTPCIGTGLTDKMSFLDRVYNSAYYVMKYISNAIVLAGYGKIKQKHNIKPYLSMRDVFADAELFLFCTDFSLDFPRPMMPNVVFVGGGYLTKTARVLDKELEDFVQSSGEDGVIIFSLGTYAEIDDEDKFRKFATGLKKLPQKIIAKYNGDQPPDYLDTTKFKLMKWIPQNDLLGHPKTKAFVSHGGLNSVYEAIYYAIPMIGIPLFYDQHDNIKAIADKGMGIALDIRTLTSDDLYEATTEVIKNPRYKDNAVRLSAIHKDKPMSPKDAMIYWTEYAIKHGGKHLQSQAVNLNIFQYYLVDVFAFIICVFGVVAIISFWTCCFVACPACHVSESSGHF
ncbi:2-hydroxyacylsphingosine 1-beta-galactosyltransferase-like [Glandiceps talaboti]